MSILEDALKDCQELCDKNTGVSEGELKAALHSYKRQMLILKIKGFLATLWNSIFYPVKK